MNKLILVSEIEGRQYSVTITKEGNKFLGKGNNETILAESEKLETTVELCLMILPDPWSKYPWSETSLKKGT